MPRIDEYHYYHGAALALVAEHEGFTSINKIPEFDSRAVYLVNHDRVIYVKHSTSRDNEWSFTFHADHQTDIRRLYDRFPDRTFIVLVCNDEICLLTYGEYAACLEENFGKSEWLTVSRPVRGGGFRVRGSRDDLKPVIPLNRYPRLLFM